MATCTRPASVRIRWDPLWEGKWTQASVPKPKAISNWKPLSVVFLKVLLSIQTTFKHRSHAQQSTQNESNHIFGSSFSHNALSGLFSFFLPLFPFLSLLLFLSFFFPPYKYFAHILWLLMVCFMVIICMRTCVSLCMCFLCLFFGSFCSVSLFHLILVVCFDSITIFRYLYSNEKYKS